MIFLFTMLWLLLVSNGGNIIYLDYWHSLLQWKRKNQKLISRSSSIKTSLKRSLYSSPSETWGDLASLNKLEVICKVRSWIYSNVLSANNCSMIQCISAVLIVSVVYVLTPFSKRRWKNFARHVKLTDQSLQSEKT